MLARYSRYLEMKLRKVFIECWDTIVNKGVLFKCLDEAINRRKLHHWLSQESITLFLTWVTPTVYTVGLYSQLSFISIERTTSTKMKGGNLQNKLLPLFSTSL